MKIASFEKREWINPKTDRRPMTEDWVLITVMVGNRPETSIGKFMSYGEWCGEDSEDVIAWMPLPDPAEVME